MFPWIFQLFKEYDIYFILILLSQFVLSSFNDQLCLIWLSVYSFGVRLCFCSVLLAFLMEYYEDICMIT